MIGEVVFSDKPGHVYHNTCALPQFATHRVYLGMNPEGSAEPARPSNIIPFPTMR